MNGKYVACMCAAFAFCVCTLCAIAHDSPIDHVARTIKLSADGNRLFIRYQIQLTERTALLELNDMDADGNGTISDAEQTTFFETKAREIAGELSMEIDGKVTAVEPAGVATLDADFGQTYLFSTLLGNLPAGPHRGRFVDRYSWRYPGPYRWLPQDPIAAGGGARIEPIAPAAVPPDQKLETILLEFNLVTKAAKSR